MSPSFHVLFTIEENNLIRIDVQISISCVIIGAIADTGAMYSFMDCHLFREICSIQRDEITLGAPDCATIQSSTGHQQKVIGCVRLPTKLHLRDELLSENYNVVDKQLVPLLLGADMLIENAFCADYATHIIMVQTLRIIALRRNYKANCVRDLYWWVYHHFG